MTSPSAESTAPQTVFDGSGRLNDLGDLALPVRQDDHVVARVEPVRQRVDRLLVLGRQHALRDLAKQPRHAAQVDHVDDQHVLGAGEALAHCVFDDNGVFLRFLRKADEHRNHARRLQRHGAFGAHGGQREVGRVSDGLRLLVAVFVIGEVALVLDAQELEAGVVVAALGAGLAVEQAFDADRVQPLPFEQEGVQTGKMFLPSLVGFAVLRNRF